MIFSAITPPKAGAILISERYEYSTHVSNGKILRVRHVLLSVDSRKFFPRTTYDNSRYSNRISHAELLRIIAEFNVGE